MSLRKCPGAQTGSQGDPPRRQGQISGDREEVGAPDPATAQDRETACLYQPESSSLPTVHLQGFCTSGCSPVPAVLPSHCRSLSTTARDTPCPSLQARPCSKGKTPFWNHKSVLSLQRGSSLPREHACNYREISTPCLSRQTSDTLTGTRACRGLSQPRHRHGLLLFCDPHLSLCCCLGFAFTPPFPYLYTLSSCRSQGHTLLHLLIL